MEGIRNKAAWALVVALSLLLIASLAGVVRGGPLDPTGPPGSTGKNIITSLPFTISQPGSYVLNVVDLLFYKGKVPTRCA